MRVAMVTGEDGQEPGAQCVSLMLISAAAVGVAQRATVDPRLVDPGGGKKLGEEGQLSVGRGAGLVIPADMDAASRCLHRKRLQLGTIDGNLGLRRLTHRVTPPSR